MQATYLDLTEWFSTISPARSPSNTFIQVLLKTDKPRVNDDVELEVNSTVPLRYFNYEVIGRGDVQTASTVGFSFLISSYVFELKLSYVIIWVGT